MLEYYNIITCPAHTQHMPSTQHIPSTYPAHAQHMPSTCPAHAQHIPSTYPAHTQHIPSTFHGCRMVILQYAGGGVEISFFRIHKNPPLCQSCRCTAVIPTEGCRACGKGVEEHGSRGDHRNRRSSAACTVTARNAHETAEMPPYA